MSTVRKVYVSECLKRNERSQSEQKKTLFRATLGRSVPIRGKFKGGGGGGGGG